MSDDILAPTQSIVLARQKWLEEAQQGSEPDPYLNKRSTPRYEWYSHLDMRGEQGTSLVATGRNISVGGVQLHCRHEVGPQTRLYLCTYDDPIWVPLRVRHVTQTVNGYLIGAEFE